MLLRDGTQGLTMKTTKHNLTNRNAQPEGRALSVTGFDGHYRVDSILPYSIALTQDLYLQVRLFRAVKKNCISGEPASPIADSCTCSERIKTDYNSYLCTCHSLIVNYFNNLCEIARLARGMVAVFRKLKRG